MGTLKHLLLGLLLLISISFIFTRPGYGYLDIAKENGFYPPGTYGLTHIITTYFPLEATSLTSHQQTWIVFKLTLFGFYLLTLVTLLLLAKTNKASQKIPPIDIAISYLMSFSLMLGGLALGYVELLAAPFIVLTTLFLFKKNYTVAGFFYLIAVSFNWTTLVFALPCFLFVLSSRKRTPRTTLIPLIAFLSIPASIVAYLIYLFVTNPTIYLKGKVSVLFGLPWFFSEPFNILLQHPDERNILTIGLALVTSLFSVFVFGYLLRNVLLQNVRIQHKFLKILILISPVVFLAIAVTWPNLSTPIFTGLFLLVLVKLIVASRSHRTVSPSLLLIMCFVAYLSFVILVPGIVEANLMWLILISIMLFILNRSQFTTIQLVAVNLVVFVELFIFQGSAGTQPVRGVYFETMRLFLYGAGVIGCLWYIKLFTKRNLGKYTPNLNSSSTVINTIKKFLIVFLIIFNFGLIPGQGSPDVVSWTQYAIATTQHLNPFFAQTVVDQRYPPLATVEQGIFANLWKYTVGFRPSPLGESRDYLLSTKVSIIFFYFLSLFLYIKFSNALRIQKASIISKSLIILTTFTLTVQTQGLADLNIYVLPPVLAAIFMLFRRKYFLSGIFMGIAVATKWQPIILLPIFGATLFNFQNPPLISIKRSALFIMGVLPIPIITWLLVIINPGGIEAFNRSFDYLLHGAPMLSGQALNVNWIVTYYIHIFRPELDVSLEHLGGLNRQIPTSVAPLIFQGYLFLGAAVVIVLRYWLFQRKKFDSFMSAAIMIFFSHFILNKSAYEKHLFYTVAFMLFFFLVRPTRVNRMLLIIFDIMAVINLIFFYGFTGPKDVNRLFFGFDLTVLFASYYVVIYMWVLWLYLRGGLLFGKEKAQSTQL